LGSNQIFDTGTDMDTITIRIDAELAAAYVRQYRELLPERVTEALDDERLLEAFVHDRLREETEFLAKE
jgi:hypothetical protein